jgi:hypothetical protein
MKEREALLRAVLHLQAGDRGGLMPTRNVRADAFDRAVMHRGRMRRARPEAANGVSPNEQRVPYRGANQGSLVTRLAR